MPEPVSDLDQIVFEVSDDNLFDADPDPDKDKDLDPDKDKDLDKDKDKDLDPDKDKDLDKDKDKDLDLDKDKDLNKDKDPDKDKKPDPEPKTATELRLEQLEKENKRLGYSLRKAQNEFKKKDTASEEVLTKEQIKSLISEHGNDPDVMFDIMEYTAKQASKAELDVKEDATMRRHHDAHVQELWPDMADESSDLYQQYQEATVPLRLEGHPLKEFLTLGSMVVAELPKIKQAAYEQGKADALKEVADNKRKKDIKKNKLSPSGDPVITEDEKLSKDQVSTEKQMELTPAQKKIYRKFVKEEK